MRKVYAHENLAILTAAKNLLELNQIECFSKNEFHASGGHVGWAGIPIELWVYDDTQADEAIALLETEFTAPEAGAEWTCASCGEVNEGSFETCWKCQAPAEAAGHDY